MYKLSSTQNNTILDGQFMRDSVDFNLKIEEALAMLKNQTMPENSPLNVTGQAKAYHDDIVMKQLAAINKKSPYEKNLRHYCENDTKDEKYREYGRKLAEYDQFRFKAIEI